MTVELVSGLTKNHNRVALVNIKKNQFKKKTECSSFLQPFQSAHCNHTALKEIIPNALSFDNIVTVAVLGHPSFTFAEGF